MCDTPMLRAVAMGIIDFHAMDEEQQAKAFQDIQLELGKYDLIITSIQWLPYPIRYTVKSTVGIRWLRHGMYSRPPTLMEAVQYAYTVVNEVNETTVG